LIKWWAIAYGPGIERRDCSAPSAPGSPPAPLAVEAVTISSLAWLTSSRVNQLASWKQYHQDGRVQIERSACFCYHSYETVNQSKRAVHISIYILLEAAPPILAPLHCLTHDTSDLKLFGVNRDICTAGFSDETHLPRGMRCLQQ